MAFGFSDYMPAVNAGINFLGNNPVNGNVADSVNDVSNHIGYTASSWNNGNNGNGWSWLGNNGVIPTAFGGLQALGGLANAYTGLQQLGLARKQFGFAKDAFNAQLGNSITNYGNAAANARRVAYALQGDYAPRAFGTNSQQQAGENYKREVTNGMVRSV